MTDSEPMRQARIVTLATLLTVTILQGCSSPGDATGGQQAASGKEQAKQKAVSACTNWEAQAKAPSGQSTIYVNRAKADIDAATQLDPAWSSLSADMATYMDTSSRFRGQGNLDSRLEAGRTMVEVLKQVNEACASVTARK